MDIKRKAARGIAVLAVALAAGHLVQNMSAAPAPKPVASAELTKTPVKVETAINYLINEKKVPVAGTSAGMAILGDFYYAPTHEGVLSSEILNKEMSAKWPNINKKKRPTA